MTKAELVREISYDTGIIKKDVAIVVDAFLEATIESLKSNKHIEIRGFGTFKNKVRQGGIGRNPKTGVEVEIPVRVIPTFKFSRSFKKAVTKSNKV